MKRNWAMFLAMVFLVFDAAGVCAPAIGFFWFNLPETKKSLPVRNPHPAEHLE